MQIALCSWSLGIPHDEPTLRQHVQRLGLNAAHLALGPLLDLPDHDRPAAIAAYQSSPLTLTAGMIGFPGEDYSTLQTIHDTGGYVPDAHFEARFSRTLAAAHIAHTLGLSLLSTHAGFIPNAADHIMSFNTLVSRVQRVADALAPLGITLLLETGQESADTLAAFLKALDRPNVGVNFDPANMILYGKGDPINAAIRLAPHIRHVHAKDARRLTPAPAYPEWPADEVPVGQGDAKVAELVRTLHRLGYRGSIAIEREAGPTRSKDIALAISLLRECVSSLPAAP